MKLKKTVNSLAIKCLFSAIFTDDEYTLPKKSINWIMYDNIIPVGFCSIYKLERENGAFLALAGILPRYRGKGLHKRLIRVRITWAKKQGMEYIITYTVKDNQPSFDNLQDFGFRLYNPEYQYAGKDMYYWIKQLV